MRDVLAYLRKCFRVAVEVRERRKAMIALLAALLALPVIWSVGGKLEFTQQGLFWVAAWLTISSALLVFVISPFLIWKEQNKATAHLTRANDALTAELEREKVGANANPPERISFVEFRKVAESEFGWDFNSYSTQLLDFANGIRQAAVDGVLVLDGRLGCTDQSMKDQFPLVKIPSEHFAKFAVSPFGEYNYDLQTYSLGHPRDKDGRYRDLHLGDKDAATSWLRGIGKSWQTPQPDAELETVLNHIAHYSAIDSWTDAKREFENAAKNGELSVWGREVSDPSWIRSAYGKLTPEYWRHACLDIHTFSDATAMSDNAFAKRDSDGNTLQRTTSEDEDEWPKFAYLRVNKCKVLQFWPSTKPGSPLDT